eukprot:GFUD01032495.1.p1 GENE.GFUD01032495.1~~GFUD01032495.1.p1  ORF type:complete len:307 (+),score=77.60 GFUD01032495.1:110-1030(+)
MEDKSLLTILHYNDVYNISSRWREPVGGYRRFLTKLKSHKDKNPLVLFSGDALSPSLQSTVTHGEHMVRALNSLGTQCAVLGNHEFDYGLQNLNRLVKMSNFPWLLSNMTEAGSGLPLAGARTHYVLEWAGLRIGMVGLVEDWLYQQQAVREVSYQYEDYVEVGKRLAEGLKKDGCHIVIALTHMGMREDIRLVENVPEIDLVLGGHDHQYEVQVVEGRTIVKSGTEFRYLSVVTVALKTEGGVTVDVEREEITADVEESRDVDVGLEENKMRMMWFIPLYAWWAVKYHGYKRLVKFRRALARRSE